MSNMHQMLLQGLKQLKTEVPAPHMGICDNVYHVMDDLFGQSDCWVIPAEDGVEIDVFMWIQETAQKWPKWSGDINYPVPVPTNMGLAELKAGVHTPMDAYHHFHNVWEGAYGQLRMELLDFLIQELENGTAATPA